MKADQVSPLYTSFLQDESGLKGQAESICFPESPEELAEAIGASSGPVTIQGARTGLRGGAVPMGGLIINLSHMDKIGSVLQKNGTYTVTVEAGVTLENIGKLVQAEGLLFPPDPTEQTATIGGLFASGGAGPGVYGYGTSSQYIDGLRWVTPFGQIWDISRGVYCSSEGKLRLPDGNRVDSFKDNEDLIDFLAGSEGSLGTAASLTLKLLPLPKDIWGVVFFFSNEENALQFASGLENIHWQRAGMTAAEYFDGTTLAILRKHKSHMLLNKLPDFPKESRAALYVEIIAPGEEASADALMEIMDLFDSQGGSEEETWAENGYGAVEKFRKMRHAVPAILNEMQHIRSVDGYRYEVDFFGNPLYYRDTIRDCRALLEGFQVPGAIYGHLLNNSLHMALLPENAKQQTSCTQILWDSAVMARKQGGSPVSEYGAGKIKQDLYLKNLSLEDREKLINTKKIMDPKDIMGPLGENL